MTEVYQVTITVPDEAAGGVLADELVGKRLAACVQLLGPIRSVYRWEGKIEDNPEWMCIAKTTAGRFPALLEAVRKLHPYRVPEVLAMPASDGNPDYLKWVADCVKEE
ncbi:MAG: hypothetical protein A2Y33_15655 [Spirochaetes bacterium GWF1_51_8]|nr:MAG: hypothetical protein A2Y33_15655 [Spirochaetes bacterium GWF1_51_8]